MTWQKSTHSGNDNCAEVATVNGRVLVRSSERPADIVSCTPREFAAWLDEVRATVT